MIIPLGRDEHVPNKQGNELWVKVSDNDTEICQRQEFNEYEIIQEEYLRNLEMTDHIENNQDICQMRDYSQIQRETKTDKMRKLRRETELLENGVQRVRTKLDRLHQDSAQTPSMSTIGMRPNKLIDQWD